MRNKRTTIGKAKIESKDDVGLPDEPLAHLERRRVYFAWLRYVAGLLSVIASLVTALVSFTGVSWLFSDLPQIPQAYASLIGIVVSSIVGISVTFLLALFIDKRRKAETEEVIHKVRSKEKAFFQMLDLDFDSITRRRENREISA